MSKAHLQSAITTFLNRQEFERQLSENTILAYRSDLEKFASFIADGDPSQFPVGSITSLDAKDFLATIRDDEQFKPKSLARMLSSLRQFFKWCSDEGILTHNPIEGIKNPKLPQKLPVYLIEDEIEMLLRAQKAETSYLGRRDYTILISFLYTGLRLSELRGLDIKSIDFNSSCILVQNGKGGKQRLLPLHDDLANHMKDYLGIRQELEEIQDSEAFFLKPDGTRMTSRAIGYAIERSMKKAGLSQEYTPHKLRHTFATQLLHNGGNLLEIKELLGHSQLSTTSIYTHTNIQRLQKAVDKLTFTK